MCYILFREEYKRIFEKELKNYFGKFNPYKMEVALNIVLSYWNNIYLQYEINSKILQEFTIKEVYKGKTKDERILQYRHNLFIMNKEIFKDIKELFWEV